MTGVNWYGARAYAEWADKSSPDQHQWEKAMRGIDGRRYPWGDGFDSTKANTAEGGRRDTTPVGSYGDSVSSPYGCEDGSGNVWEWTRDLWDGENLSRAIRGGSWYNDSSDASCDRYGHPLFPANSDLNIGFRCART